MAMRVLLVVVLIAAVLVGVGFYMGWLNLSWTGNGQDLRDLRVGLDKDKFKSDMQKAGHAAAKAGEAVNDKLHAAVGTPTVRGTVKDVTMSPERITVDAADKKTVTAEVTDQTSIKVGERKAALEDLKPGMPVLMECNVKDGQYTARSITVQMQ
jgi:hypothetical protein